jgi:hypothetical protein
MAGIILVTNQDAAAVKEAVKKVARRLDFTIADVGDGEISLRKGSRIAGALLGAFFPFCDLRAIVRTNPDKTVEIDIQHNSPRVTGGSMGVSRVKAQAQELADKLAEDIIAQRGEILRRDTF